MMDSCVVVGLLNFGGGLISWRFCVVCISGGLCGGE